jgi:DNA polymerase
VTKALHIDFETRSACNIRTHGVYRYMDDPTTAPLFASWKLGEGPITRWNADRPCPSAIVNHVEAGGTVVAHNAGFERLLWQKILTPRYGWPVVRLEQFVCTAATAAALGLPRDLAGLGQALGLPVQKDTDGWRLINKFSVPRKPRKGEPQGVVFNDPADHAEDWERFKAYCDRDVQTEALAHAKMVPLSADEQAAWVLSERINDRGMLIDTEAVDAALRMAATAKARLDARMTRVTSGYVTACSQVEVLKAWAQSFGVGITSLAKAEIEDWLEDDDLPADVREAITLRQEAAKTSVAKLEAFADRASRDGRVRGAFLYCGAGTGRWSSTGVQMHNMPRPRPVYADAHLDLEVLFHFIKRADPDLLEFLYGTDLGGRPLSLLADAIRSFIRAAPGHDIIAADYSGIEGAVAAWFAGEGWKVEALFGLITDPSLPDLYRRAAASIYNTTADQIPKKDFRRQVGKVAELALQYQGGPGAFRSMARNYALKLDGIFDPVWEAADDARRAKAEKRYETVLAQKLPVAAQMTRREFLAAELVKLGWRAGHPAIVASWDLLASAAHAAVESAGSIVSALRVDFLLRAGFLWCRLPSGRCLAYASPKLQEQVWVKRKDSEASETMPREQAQKLVLRGEAVIEDDARPVVTVAGVDSVTRRFTRYPLYGGLLLENVVQAIARDLLLNGMHKAEASGYAVIGHVHDEIIAEVPRGYGNHKTFERLICDLPAWAAGLPLTAAAFRASRYMKD